ncbi:potassium channel subfamily K member 18 isoform X2 [Conger conger]|uniref:potassium channel subfamily K member 18 isoform X2 n=1 Tax=Conger conger TaxID=82655 RepID=UPI002A5A11F8|nr:potassium channel subfamily K member 18 isoform X2 [Conger conger]
MSVAIEDGQQSSEKRSRCIRLLSILFPLGCLIVLLVGYAALGALSFRYIEGGTINGSMNQEYKTFLLTLVHTVRNSSRNGYGNMYPVTVAGKWLCVIYAMVGIPLMLLVLTDVGDILAILVSKAYLQVHKLCSHLSLRARSSWGPSEKPVEEAGVQNAVYTFSQDAVVRVPMDIRQVLRSQASVKRKSIKLHNDQIFERIITQENLARENLLRQRGLAALPRSQSCPDLSRAEPQRGIWDLCTGEELEKLDVPLMLILVLFFAYLLFGGLILPLWEEEIGTFDAFYFCFVTLTTIGFGDIVPQHPNFFMVTFLFLITGMAILSMAFKLGQSRFVGYYRTFIRCISGGKVLKYK